MDRFAVIDATAPAAKGCITGHAARWLEWELRGLGADIVAAREADIILVTCVSTDIAPAVAREMKREGVERSRQKIVIGGHAAMTPAVFDPFIDLACVGEGRRMVRTLALEGWEAASALPEAWVPGETREVIPNTEYPWDMPPSDVGDGGIRVIAERGCARACLFCGVGWGQPHIRAPYDVGARVDELVDAGYVPHVSANDLGVVPIHWASGRYSSVSYSALRTWLNEGVLPRTEILRIGVEGPSERLRKAVRKPIPEEGLWEVTEAVIAAGHKVKWQLICGLPGERDEDLDELRRHIRRARSLPRSVLMISWTSYVPHPATPLSVFPLDDSYDMRYESFLSNFHSSDLWTRRVWLGRGQGASRRLQGAMRHTGTSEAELRRGWWDHEQPCWRIAYPHRERLRDVARRYWAEVAQ